MRVAEQDNHGGWGAARWELIKRRRVYIIYEPDEARLRKGWECGSMSGEALRVQSKVKVVWILGRAERGQLE